MTDRQILEADVRSVADDDASLSAQSVGIASQPIGEMGVVDGDQSVGADENVVTGDRDDAVVGDEQASGRSGEISERCATRSWQSSTSVVGTDPISLVARVS